MIARGKREAKLNASPLVTNNNFEQSTESAKYQRKLFRSFRASRPLCVLNQGRRTSRCSALAPGFHIPRFWRLPPGLHIPRLGRWRKPPLALARHFDKERIDRDFHGRCVVDVEQRLCGPVRIALVDHTAGKVLLTRRIVGGKDSVEVFPDSHQVSVVTKVRIEFELGYFGRCGG